MSDLGTQELLIILLVLIFPVALGGLIWVLISITKRNRRSTDLAAVGYGVGVPSGSTAPPPPPSAPAASAPNWYPDPTKRFQFRYHDGLRWTEHVSIDGSQTIDPFAG